MISGLTNIYSPSNYEHLEQQKKHQIAVSIARNLFQPNTQDENLDHYKITDDGITAIIAHTGHLNFYITDQVHLYNSDPVNNRDANRLKKACKEEGLDLLITHNIN